MKKKEEYQKIQFAELRKKKIEEEMKKNSLEEEENKRKLQIQKIFEEWEKNKVLQKNKEKKGKEKNKLDIIHKINKDREKIHNRDKSNIRNESKSHDKSEKSELVSLRDLRKIDDYERSTDLTPKNFKTIELPNNLKFTHSIPLPNWFKYNISSPISKRKFKIQMNTTGNSFKSRSLNIDLQGNLTRKLGSCKTNRNSPSSSSTSLVKPYILLPNINPHNATMQFVIIYFIINV